MRRIFSGSSLLDKQQQYRLLLDLLNHGQFTSGADLAKQLGCSRTVVHRRLQDLQEHGLLIHAIAGRGYRLVHTDVTFNCPLLDLPHQLQHHHHTMTTSTNRDAFRLLQLQADPVMVSTDFQTVGRGRRGQQWESPFGANLLFSVGFWLSQQEVFHPYSLHVGVLLAQTLKQQLGLPFQLKWPNDLWLEQKKCAGILVELQSFQGRTALVVGIGINVNAAPLGVDQAVTSLANHVGHRLNREHLLMPIVKALWQWRERDFIWPWQDGWDDYDALKGKDVWLLQGANRTAGRVLGISPMGALLVDTASGRIEVTGGELSVRIT